MFLNIVICEFLYIYIYIWLCIIEYVIILVEMKPVYWGLKGNQDTMITYTSICFSIELIYVMIGLYVHM